MSKLKILSSGSSGNCIAVYDSRGKYILLDVGLGYKDILNGLNWNLSNCVSVYCSHLHRDHSKALAHFIDAGVPCFANYNVCEHYIGCNAINEAVKTVVDGFKVQTFGLIHNVENNAFIVDTLDQIRVLYCTDTQYVPKRVKGVNVAIVEANYDDEVIVDNLCEGVESRSQFENHHSLESCIDYLKTIYSADLTSVILWHPSGTNLNKKEAVRRVKEELGFEAVYMAEKGLELEISNSEF